MTDCSTLGNSHLAAQHMRVLQDIVDWLNAVVTHFLHGSTYLLPQPLCLDLRQHLGIEGLVMVIPVAAPAHATPVQDNTAQHGTAARSVKQSTDGYAWGLLLTGLHAACRSSLQAEARVRAWS
jgi:hypothetical protein